jgi:hypothetical protein
MVSEVGQGYRISVVQDEKSSRDCTTIWAHLTSLNHIFTNGYDGKGHIMCILPHLKKNTLCHFEPQLQYFLLWLFWRQGLAFYPDRPGKQSSYFMLPTIAGMICICHHIQLLTEMGSRERFLSELVSWSQPPK